MVLVLVDACRQFNSQFPVAVDNYQLTAAGHINAASATALERLSLSDNNCRLMQKASGANAARYLMSTCS